MSFSLPPALPSHAKIKDTPESLDQHNNRLLKRIGDTRVIDTHHPKRGGRTNNTRTIAQLIVRALLEDTEDIMSLQEIDRGLQSARARPAVFPKARPMVSGTRSRSPR